MKTRTNKIEIRRAATSSDWQHARVLLLDYLEWIRAAAGFDPLCVQPSFADDLNDLTYRYGGHDAALFVAYDDGLAVGTIAVRYHEDGSAELRRLYVRPVVRGRGLAAELLQQVIEAAAQFGCGSIWLESLPGVMDTAIKLYRRSGFQVVTHEKPGDQAVDLLLMERRLTRPAVACTTLM